MVFNLDEKCLGLFLYFISLSDIFMIQLYQLNTVQRKDTNSMKQYSFNLFKKPHEEFMQFVPAFRRSNIIREFIKNDYELPSALKDDTATSNGETETCVYYLDDTSNSLLDSMVLASKSNRSVVMRDILIKITEKYKLEPLEEVTLITRTFSLVPGTIAELKSYIAYGDRDTVVDHFILNSYTMPASTKTTTELKSRPKGGTESLLIKISETAYEKLDTIASKLGDKVKRSHVFKDVIEQLLVHLREHNPYQVELEKKLEVTIEDLRNYATDGEIKEVVENYLLSSKNNNAKSDE